MAESRPLVRRIVLALDMGTSQASLELAGELAERLGAELLALFVEDEHLLQVADYPHVEHIFLTTGERGQVDSQQLGHHLRAAAQQSHEAVAALSKRRGLSFAFSVVRGSVTDELGRIATTEDLVVVDSGTPSAGSPERGSATEEAALSLPSSLARSRGRRPHPEGAVVAICFGADHLERLLIFGGRMVRASARELWLLVAGQDAIATSERARHWLSTHGVRSSVLRTADPAADLGPLLNRLHPTILLVAGEQAMELEARMGPAAQDIPTLFIR